MTAPDKRALFRTLLRIRMTEEAIAKHYPEQEMRCPCHLSIGQEAVSVGVCAALRKDDMLFGTYRGHAMYLAKGGDLKAMVAEIYGKATGCTRGRGGSMQLIAPEVGLLCTSALVGGTIPIAAGAALAAKMQKSDRVSVVVHGDGATEEGVFHESLNFAAMHKLPMIFVCEHNYYAVYSHQNVRQYADDIYKRVKPYGMPTSRLDGNDLMKVHTAVATAVARARAGEGPSFMEFRTYRHLEHVGPNTDTHLGYRSEAEVRKWKRRDPVKLFRKELVAEGALTDADIDAMQKEFAQEIDDAIAFAKSSPWPEPDELEKWVYA